MAVFGTKGKVFGLKGEKYLLLSQILLILCRRIKIRDAQKELPRPFIQELNVKMNTMKRLRMVFLSVGFVGMSITAQRFEPIKYGDFNNWLTRNIKESTLLGGNTKKIYEICPTGTDNSGNAYVNRGGSPWATSNVLAKPAGVAKASNAVFPENREGHGKCARLVCQYDNCKAIGIVNIEVIVGGTIYLGEMIEPVKSTNNPYSKMNMGMPFTKQPKALRFDYKFYMPNSNQRIYSSGFGSKKTLAGADSGETVVLLQKRWEDKDGNLFAHRVGTGREFYKKSTNGWINNHDLKIVYGSAGSSLKGLVPASKSYYAKNSKGKMVPVKEVGWAPAGTAPTHAIVMFSAAGGEPYTGTPGLTLWIDNVGWVY